MKKFLCLILSLMFIIPVSLIFTGCNEIGVSTAEELRDKLLSADDGATIVLNSDITLSEDSIESRFVVTKKLNLNLNGKSIIAKKGDGYINENGNTNDANSLWNDLTFIFVVDEGGDLTITGNGLIDGISGDVYAFNVVNNGKLTIENGTIKGSCTAIQVNKGEANIKGGEFSVIPAGGMTDCRYLLNLIDANGKDGTAKINVSGGKFSKFDPSNNLAENPQVNFVVDGYESRLIENTDVYEVVKSANI